MNDEWEGIWKEVVMTKFVVLSCHIHVGTEESHEEKGTWRIVSVLGEIQTGHLLHTNLEHYC
jgi:gamma-glutamyl:cysteine ligase YbdK (ATP-grasp superfamily)